MKLNELQKDAMRVLKETSRTFYIPITFLKGDLKTAVANAYLMMRAIDEIEDHEHEAITNEVKSELLTEISKLLLKETFDEEKYMAIIEPYKQYLPEVTMRLSDWISLVPKECKQLVKNSTSEMAHGMAKWAKNNWDVKTKEDLDEYTYYVAGLVGVMLSDLWKWDAGIVTDRELAIGFGRGLQAVNILRNQDEDLTERGVSFVPEGWTRDHLFEYAQHNLKKADEYVKSINKRSILLFCKLPLAFAHKTLKVMKNGREKLSRAEVEKIVAEVTEQ